MARPPSTTQRILSALLIAAAVTLVVAGLLWFMAPRDVVGPIRSAEPETAAEASPTLEPAGAEPTDPRGEPASPRAAATDPPDPPDPTDPTGPPARSAQRPGSGASDPTPAPTARPDPPGEPAVATRVVVPSLDIDLPIV